MNASMLQRWRNLTAKLNWSDIIFWASGVACGFAAMICWTFFDRIENWDDLRFVVAAFWLVAGGYLFTMAIEAK